MDKISQITVPVFLASMIFEAILSARENLDNFEKADTRTNITIGAIGLVVNIIVKAFFLYVFSIVNQYALFSIPKTFAVSIGLFFILDLYHYSFHVLGHKSRFFWAMHVIHHSSRKFNLTTALRTPFTNAVFRFGFMTPLALIGFDSTLILFCDSIILTATFFQHTEIIRKLGWLEYIFSTPSHHRVHHACDEKYIDKNFGGMLIVWDKVFGTFQVEEEKPTYGITKPIDEKSANRVITQEFRDMIKDVAIASGWREKLKVVFGSPGYKPSMKVRTTHRDPNSASLRSAAILSIIFLTSITTIRAQVDERMQKCIDHESRHDYASALACYRQVIDTGVPNSEATWRAARMMANIAGHSTDRSAKYKQAMEARDMARRAIQLDSKSKDARLAYIISMGLLSEAASSPREKLQNAKIIRSEADALLNMDSAYAPAHYILGKWHYELAKLNWIERLACNTLFGGLPGDVSFERSLRYLEKAIALQPDYILFHYAKACTLYETGKYGDAIRELELALSLPRQEPADKTRHEKCADLLARSKSLAGKS